MSCGISAGVNFLSSTITLRVMAMRYILLSWKRPNTSKSRGGRSRSRIKHIFEAVKITYSETVRVGANLDAETTAANTQIVYHPFWVTEKSYICPNGIRRHEGQSNGCRKACIELCGSRGAFIDGQILKVLVIRKTVVFNRDICIGGR